jgi:hypothetical protein
MIGDLIPGITFHHPQKARRRGGLLGVGLALLVLAGGTSVSEAGVLTKEDFKLYGYVDASYTQNFNNPKNAGPNLLRLIGLLQP